MTTPDLFNPGRPARLTAGGLELEGFSVSALATYVSVPRFKAAFDLGFCPEGLVSTPSVFLSHTHLDHAAGVPVWAALREMRAMEGGRVYCPIESAAALLGLFDAHGLLEENDAGSAVQVMGLEHGSVTPLKGCPGLAVHAFAAHHRIPSLGYTVVETRRKLLPEYVGRSGDEIAALKRGGTPITEDTAVPLFTYIGDCTATTLRAHPEVGASKVLCIEATHLEDGEEELSARYGHTHLRHLVELFEEGGGALQAETIILKHFSMRYRDAETIRTRVAATLPPALLARTQLLLAP